MRRRPWAAPLYLLLAAIICIALWGVGAWAQNGDVIVYVTDTGTKYHRQDCTYLESKRAIPLKTAVSSGYGPCSRCNPPTLGEESATDDDPYVSNWDGESHSNGTGTETKASTGGATAGSKTTLWETVLGTLLLVGAIIVVYCGPVGLVVGGIWLLSSITSPDRPKEAEKVEPAPQKKALPPQSENEPPYSLLVSVGLDKDGKEIFETVYADNPDELMERVIEVMKKRK